MARAATLVEPPLAATLRRCSELGVEGFPARLGVGRPRGARWLSREELVRPNTLSRMMDGIGRAAATAKPAVQGTWLLEAYVGALVGPAAAAALTEARIPDIAADNV